MPELPAPELRSVGGIVARGWRGWRLLDQTPPEHQPFYDDRYKLLDGVEVPGGPSRQPPDVPAPSRVALTPETAAQCRPERRKRERLAPATSGSRRKAGGPPGRAP